MRATEAAILSLAVATPTAAAGPPAGGSQAAQQSAPPEQEAAPRAPPACWKLDLGVGTDFPLNLGGRLLLESPDRIRVATGLGVLPNAYVGLFNEILLAAGSYDQGLGEMLSSALTDSLVWRLEGGWRPWDDLGWYASVGYQLVTLGGGVQGEEVLALYVDVPEEFKHRPSVYNRRYELEATLHMILVELGHEWVMWDHFSVRLALSYAGTLAATSEVNPELPMYGTDSFVAFTRDVEVLVGDMSTDYVHLPMLSLSVGFRVLGSEYVRGH